jgi:MFS family permease
MSLPHEVAFVCLLCFAQLMTQAGLAISIVPLHQISKHFGLTSPGQSSWMPAAYSLTVGTFILCGGRWGDVFGHKRLVLVGWAWYALWLILGGVSYYSNQVFFDICRAFQGIGPAILLPNTIAIMGVAYPDSVRKHMAFSMYGAMAPNGFLVGAVFSGLLGQLAGYWPAIYFTIAGLCVVIGVLTYFIVPHSEESHATTPEEQDLDVLGSITGVGGLVLLNFAWNQAPVVGWSTVYVYVLLIVSFLVLGVFFLVESRAVNPLVPFRALNKEIALVCAAISAGWSSFGIWLYYLWQFEQELRFHSPLLVTARFVPAGISGALAALTGGFFISRVGPGAIMLVSMTAFTVGTILLATMPVGQVYWAQTFVSTVIMPWGMVSGAAPGRFWSQAEFADGLSPCVSGNPFRQDMSFPSATIIMSNYMPRRFQGLGASLVNLFVNYSISLALGIAGTVETQINEDGLHLLQGYRAAWYFGIGCGALGMALSVWLMLETRWARRRAERAARDVKEKGAY